jgi:DNA mismatch endonuclease (patch repair protein)
MKRTRRRDTSAEVALRRELYRIGLRYRIDYRITGIRARPDIVIIASRLAVFVDGCFWHACPIHGTEPKRNVAWWKEKLENNVRRDREGRRQLESAGWTVIRVWEHENVAEAAERIAKLVRQLRA